LVVDNRVDPWFADGLTDDGADGVEWHGHGVGVRPERSRRGGGLSEVPAGLPGDAGTGLLTPRPNWPRLEERDGSNDLVARYTYSPGYIDAVAVQERDLNSDDDFGDDDEVVYYHGNTLHSAYCLTDDGETVVERYRFDGYGACTVLDPDGSDDSDNASDVDNPFLFTGRRLDSEWGGMQYRNRSYSTTLGRFVSRDPAGYVDGMELYSYSRQAPTQAVDPLGLASYEWRYSFVVPMVGCRYDFGLELDFGEPLFDDDAPWEGASRWAMMTSYYPGDFAERFDPQDTLRAGEWIIRGPDPSLSTEQRPDGLGTVWWNRIVCYWTCSRYRFEEREGTQPISGSFSLVSTCPPLAVDVPFDVEAIAYEWRAIEEVTAPRLRTVTLAYLPSGAPWPYDPSGRNPNPTRAQQIDQCIEHALPTAQDCEEHILERQSLKIEEQWHSSVDLEG
jgi:RHS repeat-associated protein